MKLFPVILTDVEWRSVLENIENLSEKQVKVSDIPF
jgi:hypothetical protein